MNLKETKFTTTIAFGYVCKVFWGPKIPAKEMTIVWNCTQAFLFGPAGASLLISNMTASDVGGSFALALTGVTARMVAVIAATTRQGYSVRERIYIACCWFGKGSITALLGGFILIESASLPESYTVYKDYGIKMSTCSVITILLTLPISSLLTSLLGELWLDKPQQTPKSTSDIE